MKFMVRLMIGHCRKQIEPEIGEIPVGFVAKTEGSELSEDDVKQFVAKEVQFISLQTSQIKGVFFFCFALMYILIF